MKICRKIIHRITTIHIVNMVSVSLLIMLGSNVVYSQAPKYSNEFLSIGVGARALGMSNAYVASANDATASYWNPSGLAQMSSDLQVSLMHSEYFAGIFKYDYGTFAKRIDTTSVMAISVIRLGVDGIPNTIDLIDSEGYINYDKIESFSVADYGFLFSYAKRLKIEGLRVGANAKIIYRKAGDFATAWGFGLDAGVQYDYKQWRFGAMARDITTTFNAWSYNLSGRTIEVFSLTGNDIPKNSLEITLPKLLLGVARTHTIKEDFRVLAEVNFDLTFDGQRNVLISNNQVSIDPHVGLELSYKNFIFLRGGIGNIQKVKAEVGNHKVTIFQPNMGVGVKIKGLTIDYALTDIGDQSVALYSNVFSLRLDLNKPQK